MNRQLITYKSGFAVQKNPTSSTSDMTSADKLVYERYELYGYNRSFPKNRNKAKISH